MELTKAQISAIEDRSRSLAVSAGAGSGKTRVLIERARRLLEKKEASLDSILAITFTEKAAFELKQRLTQVVGDEVALASANIGTFHAFCARLLREHAPLMGIDPDFSVVEEESAGILVRKAIKEAMLSLLEQNNPEARLVINELDFKNALECLEELIGHRWHAQKISNLKFEISNAEKSAEAERENELRRAVLYCFERANERHEGYKNGGLDFADLEILALRILKNNEIAERYQKQFRYIFVDEYQDINDTQAELISRLFAPKINSLTVVGDVKQSIYRFRGANLNEFKAALESADKVIHLNENFRSRPGILKFVNTVLPDFEPLIPTREDIPSLNITKVMLPAEASANERREAEAAMLASIIPSLSGSTACLFSSLKSSEVYCRELSKRGIRAVRCGGGGFFDRQEIIDIINALRIVIDRTDDVALFALARSPLIGMTDEEFLLLAKGPGHGSLYERTSNHPKGSFLARLQTAGRLNSISELIRFVSKEGGFANENTEKFFGIAADIELREKITLEDFVEYVQALREKESPASEFPEASEGAVLLMTVHQAKGLEFDNVVLCDTIRGKNYSGKRWVFVRGREMALAFKLTPADNPEADAFPTPYYKELAEIDEEADERERERLLYVAMTRARDRLIVPVHPEATRDGSWHKTLLAASGDIKGNMMNITPAALSPPRPSQDRLKTAGTAPRTTGSSLNQLPRTFTVTSLEAYSRCPYEYYLQFVLKAPSSRLNGEKTANPAIPANVRGDIVHRLIELDAIASVNDLPGTLERLSLEMAIGAIPHPEAKKILEQFRMYKESRYGSVSNARHEVPFLHEIGGHFIKGKLDMLIESPNSYEIVDFKTGDDDEEGAKKRYGLQIETYALAVSMAFGLAEGRVSLMFLGGKQMKCYEERIDPEKLQETEKKLKKIMENISKGEFEARPNCLKCPYSINKICPKRTTS